jgi:hypothetical protein
MSLPSRSQHFTRALAAAAAAAMLAAPPALARIDPPPTPSFNTRAPAPTISPANRPVVVRAVDDGFDWGAAAIGAGGVGALVVLISLGGIAYSGRHRIGVVR